MSKDQIRNITYSLEKAIPEEKEIVTEFKLKSILDYAGNLKKEEKQKIINYVEKNINSEIHDYKVIKIEGQIIGCLYIRPFEDGILLDEIYVKKAYRNRKIGSTLIKQILEENKIVYLWVYKKNVIALNLYKKLGFKVKEETNTRYFMVLIIS